MDSVQIIKGKPKKAIFFFHGNSERAEELATLEASLPFEDVIYIFLQAPYFVPKTPKKIRQWYFPWGNPVEQIEESVQGVLNHLLQIQNLHGLKLEDIHFFSYCQGSSIAFQVVSRLERLGSMTSVCGFMAFNLEPWKLNSQTKFLLLHSISDPVIPVYRHYEVKEFLETKGHEVQIKLFPGGHSISDEAFQEFINFFVTI
jgi:predicted esterase